MGNPKLGKFDSLTYLKKTKARVAYSCSRCGKNIEIGDFYFIEAMQDRFLQRLHAKKFCVDCHKYSEKS
jgi:ribosomal protein L33